jgi:hypothetical protein
MLMRWSGILLVLANLAAAPLPLALHSTDPAPRELVRGRAAAAAQLYPQIDDATVSADAAALAKGEWNMSVAHALPMLLEKAADECDSGQAGNAVVLLRQMQPVVGGDSGFLWVLGSADLATGDFGDARLAYDELLMRRPDLVAAYLGRALAAGHMGSIPRMQADLAIARSLDAKQSADFEQAHRAEIDACAAAAPKETAEKLTAEMLEQATRGADTKALLPLAAALQEAVNLHRRVPREQYQDATASRRDRSGSQER